MVVFFIAFRWIRRSTPLCGLMVLKTLMLLMPIINGLTVLFFFFQAEDGIRDLYVTGVQTCALPISVPVEEGFLTAVAPASTAYDGVNEYYPNEKEYIYAIADALREEYQAIHKAGLLLQVDDAVLANMYDDLVQISPQRYREWANLRLEALNHALTGIPEDRIRYHVCFGSWHVPHVADAPLAEIVDLILKVRAGAYSIEAANVRHEHEWRVWENGKLPRGKV